METKDTVKEVTSHSESIWCPHCGEEFGIESKVEYERETQAEITWDIAFEAGKQEGRGEVVEWIKSTFCSHEGIFVVYPEDWQAQLKEWRV